MSGSNNVQLTELISNSQVAFLNGKLYLQLLVLLRLRKSRLEMLLSQPTPTRLKQPKSLYLRLMFVR